MSSFQIVMEYCGAGSVSDIMRLRNKTVCKQISYLDLTFLYPGTSVYKSCLKHLNKKNPAFVFNFLKHLNSTIFQFWHFLFCLVPFKLV